MSCVSCLSITLWAARTCSIGDAELIWVEQEGVSVGDVQLLLLFLERGFLLVEVNCETYL